MALFAMVFWLVALVLIGVGVALGLVACVCTAILLGLGVVSSSFLLGLLSGRASLGFKAFFLQCGILAGIPAGAVCAWLGKLVSETLAAYPSDWQILLFGALAGAFAGALIGVSLDVIFRWLHLWLSARAVELKATYQTKAETLQITKP